jgi:hypothetical protein
MMFAVVCGLCHRNLQYFFISLSLFGSEDARPGLKATPLGPGIKGYLNFLSGLPPPEKL